MYYTKAIYYYKYIRSYKTTEDLTTEITLLEKKKCKGFKT